MILLWIYIPLSYLVMFLFLRAVKEERKLYFDNAMAVFAWVLSPLSLAYLVLLLICGIIVEIFDFVGKKIF